MNGFIDGNAPPFILLSIAFLSLAWLPTFLLVVTGATRRTSFKDALGAKFRRLTAASLIIPFLLISLLLIRIVGVDCRALTDCEFRLLDFAILLTLFVNFVLIFAVSWVCWSMQGQGYFAGGTQDS